MGCVNHVKAIVIEIEKKKKSSNSGWTHCIQFCINTYEKGINLFLLTLSVYLLNCRGTLGGSKTEFQTMEKVMRNCSTIFAKNTFITRVMIIYILIELLFWILQL